MNIEIKREEVAAALEMAPALRPLLTRLARSAAKGKKLPETYSAKELDYQAQLCLDRVLHFPTVRNGNGIVCGILMPKLREPAAWKDVLDLLLPEKELAPKAESVKDFLQKIRWQDPDGEEMLDRIAEMEEVVRYLENPSNRKPWKDLYFGAVDMATHAEQGVKTLSQLGSDWLNDSKALRTGPLRRQLALILGAACGMEPDEERAMFGGFGIVDNPYTSAVTVFAPFVFKLADGSVFDFPAKMFDAGLACQLPLEVVDQIRNIAWPYDDALLIRTCENAAPFATFVSRRIPTVYTEGYPNYAVQRLLGWFDQAGISVEHWGDCDLDGFRIAHLISTRISLNSVVATDVLRNPGKVKGIPLTESQRKRLEYFVANHSDFIYAEELELLLSRGCWYEQEAFPL